MVFTTFFVISCQSEFQVLSPIGHGKMKNPFTDAVRNSDLNAKIAAAFSISVKNFVDSNFGLKSHAIRNGYCVTIDLLVVLKIKLLRESSYLLGHAHSHSIK